MSNLLVAIDSWVLNRVYTPLAYWYERRTGYTNYRLASWCFGVVILSSFAMVAVAVRDMIWSVTVFMLIVALYASRDMHRAHNEDVRLRRGHRNARRSRLRFEYPLPLRIGCCLMILPYTPLAATLLLLTPIATFDLKSVYFVLIIAYPFALTSGMYLCCIQRPPPQERDEREPRLVIV